MKLLLNRSFQIILIVICVFFIKNEKTFAFDKLGYINRQDFSLFDKLLVGINIDTGFYAADNDTIYEKINYVAPVGTIPGETEEIKLFKKSLKNVFSFDYLYKFGLSFEYILSSNIFYGLEINYIKNKGIDKRKITDFNTIGRPFFEETRKNFIFNIGFIKQISILYPYFSIGVGFDNIELKANIYSLNSYSNDVFISGIKGETGVIYKRGSFSGSIGALMNLKNTILGINYKFLGSFNVGSDIMNDLKTINQIFKIEAEERNKFLTQAHIIGVSLKLAI
jgi:hypothetical protein